VHYYELITIKSCRAVSCVITELKTVSETHCVSIVRADIIDISLVFNASVTRLIARKDFIELVRLEISTYFMISLLLIQWYVESETISDSCN
jgi:hypothetical protein